MPTRPETEATLTIAPRALVTLARSEQKRKKRARDEIDGADIHVHQAVEVFGFGGFNGAHVADARIVDENVEEFELRKGCGDGFGVGDIEMQRAGGGKCARERFSSWEIDVGDPDFGACAREFLHSGFANAAGAAGDEGDAVVEAEWI